MAKKQSTTFVCDNCGYESPKWMGKCPNCGEWDSLKEFVESKKATPLGQNDTIRRKPVKINDVQLSATPRIKTAMPEMNRVLGGGIVPGSLLLIGGDPGIGKSTILLQLSSQLTHAGYKVLYVTGEESENQVKMRAERMEDFSGDFFVYAETDIGLIVRVAEELQPDLLIVDSIQTMVHPDVNGVQGSVSHVRETTATLMRLSKTNQIATFIVGHVTKDGAIAGPRMLEHMVDTVLYFEGEKFQSFRILRSVKNRFGSTNEIGVFEMTLSGLSEVSNPSELFLEERVSDAAGSAVVVSLEGTRPILAEVQSLVTPTNFGNARRTTSGLNLNRAMLIMAVLEKRAGLLLQNQDAYFKSTGGLRLDEPAIDLAVAMSVVSSYYDEPTQALDCFVGEIGLSGEIRRVNRIEERIREVEKLGFKRIFVPANNVERLPKSSLTIVGVRTVREAINKAFPKK
ncbi:DNA repair protein RadA [Atopobacter phocae]|uniref:DNA repair protein RadA n=1 Tax=Atopobacter phocae TaxID=136492 RepID=UPI000471006F|nr:DNA repair protein RadA [Atopobacter phocae]